MRKIEEQREKKDNEKKDFVVCRAHKPQIYVYSNTFIPTY